MWFGCTCTACIPGAGAKDKREEVKEDININYFLFCPQLEREDISWYKDDMTRMNGGFFNQFC